MADFEYFFFFPLVPITEDPLDSLKVTISFTRHLNRLVEIPPPYARPFRLDVVFL